MIKSFLMSDIYLEIKDETGNVCVVIDAKQTEEDKSLTKEFLEANGQNP